MRGWLSRWFPARSLDGVFAGAHCSIDTTVLTADAIAGTLAPTLAAAVRWTLLYERTEEGGRYGARATTLHAFASGWRGESLVVRAACGRGAGVVYLREHELRCGQRLRVIGRLVPAPPAGYREAASASVAQFRSEGPVILVDELRA